MFERIDGFPAGTIAIRATGTVTADDYKAVLAPAVAAATADGAARGGGLDPVVTRPSDRVA